MRGRQIKRVGFFGGVWVIRPPAPQKFSTSSTYLKPSHYDHGFWVSGLFKPCRLTDATCTCFKETALLFNVHLSCLVNFILCPTDKYMFKVNKLVFGNCSSSIYCQNDQFRKSYLLFDTCALINKDMLFKYMLLTCKNFMFSNFTWRKCFCSMKWCGRRWGREADAPWEKELNWTSLSIFSKRNIFLHFKTTEIFLISICSFEVVQHFWFEFCIFYSKLLSATN